LKIIFRYKSLFILFFSCTHLFANEFENHSCNLGFKLISEQSNDHSLENSFSDRTIYYCGFQVLRKISLQRSIESGIYFNAKVKNYFLRYRTAPFNSYYDIEYISARYHYISVPVNYRIDTKAVYISGGIFFDYLLSHTYDSEKVNDSTFLRYNDRKFYIGYNFIVGFEKSLSPVMNIFAEARLLCTISSSDNQQSFFNLQNVFDPVFLNYGLGIGMNYNIRSKSSR
jgi:hypothetical protein